MTVAKFNPTTLEAAILFTKYSMKLKTNKKKQTNSYKKLDINLKTCSLHLRFGVMYLHKSVLSFLL